MRGVPEDIVSLEKTRPVPSEPVVLIDLDCTYPELQMGNSDDVGSHKKHTNGS